MLLGLYHTTQWLQRLHRQRARRVKHALKCRGCPPQYTAHPARLSSQSNHHPLPFTCWNLSVVMFLASLALHCLYHSMLPMANLPVTLHHPATMLNLPPSYQPTHPQWSEPAKQDHVQWLEDLASAVSSSGRASWDFWTLPHSEKQQLRHTTSLTLSADHLHWAMPNATCPDPRCDSDTHRPENQLAPKTNDFPNMLHGCVHQCMGAAWQLISAAAPVKPESKPVTAPCFSNQATNTMPAAPVPAPAPAVVSNEPEKLAVPTNITPAAAATTVAIYRPHHVMERYRITALPTAVIQLPASTSTWPAVTNAADMSTSVVVYRSTQQPLTFLTDICWTFQLWVHSCGHFAALQIFCAEPDFYKQTHDQASIHDRPFHACLDDDQQQPQNGIRCT